MKEVEIKIAIGDVDGVLRQLENYGCKFSGPMSQTDAVYVPEHINELPCPEGTNVLRIRHMEGAYKFTLKRSEPGNHLSKIEHELEILQPQEMEKILHELGYKQISKISKKRRVCKLEEFEICIDIVEGLGNFLEMEILTQEDPAAAQQHMLAFLRDRGIDTSQQAEYGYDVLFFQKYGTRNV